MQERTAHMNPTSKLADRQAETAFLPGLSIEQYLQQCRRDHPRLYRCLDPHRMHSEAGLEFYRGLRHVSQHFEREDKGGRGGAYRKAQLGNPLIRAVGIQKLFELACHGRPFSPRTQVVDVLGGNGTLCRAMRLLHEPESCPAIYTSDASEDMVADALRQGIAALRQPAQYMMLKDSCVDGMIFAYGTHHIPSHELSAALQEAYRVLRPGGRVVLQDFETGTPTARWYSEVLHRYTETGHDFEHFTPRSVRRLLQEAGFEEVRIQQVYDPCIVHESSPEQARIRLLDYLVSLFSLNKLLPEDGIKDEAFWDRVEKVVRGCSTLSPDELPQGVEAVTELTVRADSAGYRAELPRVALVGTGVRLGN